jgi:transcription elongation factor GreB
MEARLDYITDEGYRKLAEELDRLLRVERPKIVKGVADAAAEGDRSENAEYIYRKKELREIDRRVQYLQKRIPGLKVVDTKPSDAKKVFFGAYVELADDKGDTRTYRIVGPDETDASQGNISVDSPLALAVMKHAEGDVVVAQLPGGPSEVEIVSVRYGK